MLSMGTICERLIAKDTADFFAAKGLVDTTKKNPAPVQIERCREENYITIRTLFYLFHEVAVF